MEVIASEPILEVADGIIQGLLRIARSSKNELEQLNSSHDYVMKMVQGRDRAEVNDAIWKWLEDVDELRQQIIRMQNEVEGKHGLTGVYYSVTKFFKYQNLIPAKVRDLNTKLQLIPLFVPAPPIPAVRPVSSGNFEYFQSTTEAAGKLMEALGDDTCHIIGLYGLRGSGKTALLKAVAGEQANHYVIVFATVSIDPNVRRIQDEIADCLGFKLEENSEAGRSRRILSRLFSHKLVLVIFDDVPAKFELEDVGMPYKGDHKGLKVDPLLMEDIVLSNPVIYDGNRIVEHPKDYVSEIESLISSRDYMRRKVQSRDPAEVNEAVWKWLQDVDELLQIKIGTMEVARKLDSPHEVSLHPLSEDDAWKLFTKHSGIDDGNINESSSSLLNVAREVAVECKGLPGKIKDVGSSLKGKPIEEWEATLDSLRHSTVSHQRASNRSLCQDFKSLMIHSLVFKLGMVNIFHPDASLPGVIRKHLECEIDEPISSQDYVLKMVRSKDTGGELSRLEVARLCE
ncbi:hypothetical protein RJT34_10931 [Clitoria ternatea]|uniref:NB-ARC domain-containing protein n=1 Tax=Clitoria ternatea TaxID=43366 RepID=A0AAN9JJJ7_CLITE